MEVAHIIPFLLSKLNDKTIINPEIVRGVLLFLRLTHLRRQTNAARTWDMLQAWTQICFETLVGSNINSPVKRYLHDKDRACLLRTFRVLFRQGRGRLTVVVTCCRLSLGTNTF